MHDFKESCCEASVNMYSDAQVASRGSKLFEFPDGYNDYYAARPRMSVPEVFFNPANFLPRDVSLCPSSLAWPSHADLTAISQFSMPTPSSLTATSTIPTAPLNGAVSLPHMIINAVNACDADLLPIMLQNIVVVGGTTLMPGFVDRLQTELGTVARGVSRS